MIRFSFSLAAAIVLGAVASAAALAQDWLPIADSIVRIESASGNGTAIGTGALVVRYEQDGKQGGYILTAKHVVEQDDCLIVWRNGYRSAGRVDARGEVYDTALIRTTPPAGATAIPVAEVPAQQGDVVQAFGYGGQYGVDPKSLKLTSGTVTVQGYADHGDSYSLSCERWTQNGDSGGPIILRGQIVGIISGYSSPRDTRGPYCTPIRNLIHTVLPHCRVSPRSSGYG
jgi:hypothetical protein